MKSYGARRDWYEVSLGALGAGTAIWLALAVAAGAQTKSDPSTTLQNPTVEGRGEPAPSLPSTGQSLSERLGETGGVIKPPAGVDNEIRVAPRDPGAGAAMPVIPPSQLPANPPRGSQ
jgi:hypothetical protein